MRLIFEEVAAESARVPLRYYALVATLILRDEAKETEIPK
jgi:hypothetical protein